jgi:prepilin-type N-terminal cleavage/methylation domain-containing protein
MMLSKRITKNTSGFTIIELLIATAVFSTVLLLSLTGFLQIGQLFYKGISATQTNTVAHAAFDSIKSDIVYDSSSTAITYRNSPISGVSRMSFCVGVNRYTYIPFHQLDSAKEATEMKNTNPSAVLSWKEFGLLKDTVPVNTSCPDPFPTGGSASQMGALTKPVELLSDKSRVSKLNVSLLATSSGKLYNLDVRIAYGDDNVLSNPTDPNARCIGNAAATQFCFTTELNTTVRRGF